MITPIAATPLPQGESTLRTLRASPIFSRLGPNDLAAAVMMSQVRHYDRKRPVYHQGEPGLHVYLLREGQVKLVCYSNDGDESLLWVVRAAEEPEPGAQESNGHTPVTRPPAHPPRLFGAVELGFYTCSALPTCDITLLEWNRDQLLLRLPHLAPRMADQTSAHLRELEQRLCEMATYTVPHRLITALLRLCCSNGAVDLTREEMAQYVGTTLFTVSRCLSEWGRAGLVVVGRREHIRVLDMKALREKVMQ